jgi:hypothetical protein
MPYLGLSARNDVRITTIGSANLDGSVIVNESSADKDFRVESDGNTHMLFVNGGNNCVGIGNASPTSPLHVTGAVDFDSTLNVDGNATLGGNVGIGATTIDHKLHLEHSDTTPTFMKVENSAANLLVGVNNAGNSYVSAQTAGKPLILETVNTAALTIDSSQNSTFAGNVTLTDDKNFSFGDGTTYIQGSGANDRIKFIVTNEMMRLTPTGLGIGTDSPTQILEVKTSSSPTIELNQADTYRGAIRLAGNDLELRNSSGVIDFFVGTNNDHESNTTKAMTIDSSQNTTFTGNVALADDKKVTFGAGSDLEIYHDNSSTNDGIIKYQNENGHLKILSGVNGNGGIEIKNRTDNETYLTCVSDGAVTLYHDNAARLATSAAGVTVTGITTSTGFSGKIHPVNGTTTNYLSMKDTNELNFFNASNSSIKLYVQYDGGDLDLCGSRMIITHGGAIEFNGDIIADQHLRLRTTDDQANQWYLYTYTDDTFRINYNGAGNDELVIDTNGTVMVGKATSNLHTAGWEERASGVVGLSLSSGNSYYFSDNSNYKFYVNANGGIYNYQSNDSNLSDEREKKNIATLGSKWDAVKKWSLKEFHYNSDSDSDSKKCGVIAQDIEDDHPDLITEFELTETNKRKAVKEQQMTWMAIKALQEAMAKIETLEAKVATLEGS